MPRPERLERNTRRFAACVGWIPNAWLARARRDEDAVARRMNRSFERADILLTPVAPGPPPSIADVVGHGVARSFSLSNVVAWTAPWNAIGQPAASVPVGFDADGLPLAVQICARPNDEVTLLRLAAQLEAARPWAEPIPPVASPDS
jgi:amidase